MEEWRDVVGWEGLYQVSNGGRVLRLARQDDFTTKYGTRVKRNTTTKLLALRPSKTNKRGQVWYHQVGLHANGRHHTVYVHRLVALAFIPNPHRLPQVNHKDGDGTHNTVGNLEWCTKSENLLHAARVLKHHHGLTFPRVSRGSIRLDKRCGMLHITCKLDRKDRYVGRAQTLNEAKAKLAAWREATFRQL